MKKEKLAEIQKHVPATNEFLPEIKYVEIFLKEKNFDINETSVLFWNHFITLLERIDENNQNNFDLEDTEALSTEAKKLTQEFEEYLNRYRSFNLTPFEKYLMEIYFEQIIKGE